MEQTNNRIRYDQKIEDLFGISDITGMDKRRTARVYRVRKKKKKKKDETSHNNRPRDLGEPQRRFNLSSLVFFALGS